MFENIPKYWKYNKLADITDYIARGITPKYVELDGCPVINQKCVRDGVVDLSQARLTDYKNKPITEAKQVQKTDILVNSTGVGTLGRSGIIKDDYEGIMTADSHVMIVRPLLNKINHEYLGYNLFARQKEIEDLGTGSSGQIELSRTLLGNLKVAYPPTLAEQKEIVKILDSAAAIVKKRKEAIDITERIIPAVFYEMFGDPVSNEKGWEVCHFEKLAKMDRVNVNPADIKPEYKYIGLEHIEKETGKILLDIDAEQNVDIKSNKYYFTHDHVLYGKLRPYLNKVALPEFEGVCSTDIIPFIPNKAVTNKYFIAALMRSDWFVEMANNNSSGANLPRIDPNKVIKFKVFNPDKDLQDKFGSIFEDIEKMKVFHYKHLESAQKEFDSLLYHAFTGALTSYKYAKAG